MLEHPLQLQSLPPATSTFAQSEDRTPPMSTSAEPSRGQKGSSAIVAASTNTDETPLCITTADQNPAWTNSMGSRPSSIHLAAIKKAWKWRALFRKRAVDVSTLTSDNSPFPSSGVGLSLSHPILVTTGDATEDDFVARGRGHEWRDSPGLSNLTKGVTERGLPLALSSRKFNENGSAHAVSPPSIRSGHSWRQAISDASSATSGEGRSCYYSMASGSNGSGDPILPANIKIMAGIPSELYDVVFM